MSIKKHFSNFILEGKQLRSLAKLRSKITQLP